MPELPEVETIRRQLEKYLVGHRIKKIDIRVPKIFPKDKDKLIDGRVMATRRFGKVLVVDLDNDFSFLIHLKLTGQVVYSNQKFKNEPNKFTHVTFYLDKKARLFFNDSRKFGWIKVEKTAAVENEKFIKKLGPEPLRDLTPQKFVQIVGSTSRPIKILLMDQEKLSGVGNIYANDALWLAKINPKTPAKNLNHQKAKLLFSSILEVLKRGIKYQGASDQWYITAEGKKGSYQEHFLAYGKQGAICPRCRKEKFKKIALGGRGTYICENCQK